MNPAIIDNMSWAMAEVYAAVTDRIMINLAHHFPYAQRDMHMGSFEYQSIMLAQMGKVEKETIAIIAGSLENADEALKQALETAILEGLKNEEPKLRQAAMQGLLNGGVPQLAPSQMQAFTYYYQQSADRLNLVNTVMLESTKAAYQSTVADISQKIATTQSILNASAGEVITGVSTWNKAMHDGVQKMVKNGLTGFIDHGGHKWSPEAYVAMDVKTTMFNTARQATWERQEQYGSDLYQVSSHNGARPLCYPWQGKVISTSGRTGITQDIDGNEVIIHSQDEIESFRYGGGLFGVNCGHYPMTFIPNFSSLKGEPQDPETNAKEYAESQQQRALERRLREEKRDLEVMKAQGASEDQLKAQRDKVRSASADIDQFCDETGRARKRNREYAPVNAEFPDVPNASSVVQSKPKVTFTPAQTLQEAEEYAKNFADDVKYNGKMTVDIANQVNKELAELNEAYPITKFVEIKQNGRIGAIAQANWQTLEINAMKVNTQLAPYAVRQAEAQTALEKIAKMSPELQRKNQKTKNLCETILKSTRFAVGDYSDNIIGSTIAHEYGHVLADQYFGQINGTRAYSNANSAACKSARQKVYGVYDTAMRNGDAYKISEYATKDQYEFLAEAFASQWIGETLPQYIVDMLGDVLGHGKL